MVLSRGGRVRGGGWLLVHLLHHCGMRAVPQFSLSISPFADGSIWEWNVLWHWVVLHRPPSPKTLCSVHVVVNICHTEIYIYDLCSSKWHPGSTTLMEEYAQLSSKGPEALFSHQPHSAAYWLWPLYNRTGSTVGRQISSWICVYIKHCSNSHELWLCRGKGKNLMV